METHFVAPQQSHVQLLHIRNVTRSARRILLKPALESLYVDKCYSAEVLLVVLRFLHRLSASGSHALRAPSCRNELWYAFF